eukprot:m.80351 g.80351  ORF g.80351 m.80351 type:complete len:434 (+) comp12753_c0_seq3:161-1462(+)
MSSAHGERNVVLHLRAEQTKRGSKHGNQKPSHFRLFKAIPKRLCFPLKAIQEISQLMGQVYLGFESTGNYVVSYRVRDLLHSEGSQWRYDLIWWTFRPGRKLKKKRQVTLFQGQVFSRELLLNIHQIEDETMVIIGCLQPQKRDAAVRCDIDVVINSGDICTRLLHISFMHFSPFLSPIDLRHRTPPNSLLFSNGNYISLLLWELGDEVSRSDIPNSCNQKTTKKEVPYLTLYSSTNFPRSVSSSSLDADISLPGSSESPFVHGFSQTIWFSNESFAELCPVRPLHLRELVFDAGEFVGHVFGRNLGSYCLADFTCETLFVSDSSCLVLVMALYSEVSFEFTEASNTSCLLGEAVVGFNSEGEVQKVTKTALESHSSDSLRLSRADVVTAINKYRKETNVFHRKVWSLTNRPAFDGKPMKYMCNPVKPMAIVL